MVRRLHRTRLDPQLGLSGRADYRSRFISFLTNCNNRSISLEISDFSLLFSQESSRFPGSLCDIPHSKFAFALTEIKGLVQKNAQVHSFSRGVSKRFILTRSSFLSATDSRRDQRH